MKSVGSAGRLSESNRSLLHRQGVTMMDLVVSVLITAILAAIAAPRLAHAVASYRVQALTNRVLADLKLAQETARSTGQKETVTFDPASNQYSMSSITAMDAPNAAYSLDVSDYPYNGILTSASFSGQSAVTFDGYGFPDSSGVIELAAGAETQIITISGATGIASAGGP